MFDKTKIIKTPAHCVFLELREPRPLESVRCDRMNAGGAQMLARALEEKYGRVKAVIVPPPEDSTALHSVLTFPDRDSAARAANKLTLVYRISVGYDDDPRVIHVYDNDSTSDFVELVADSFGADVSPYDGGEK